MRAGGGSSNADAPRDKKLFSRYAIKVFHSNRKATPTPSRTLLALKNAPCLSDDRETVTQPSSYLQSSISHGKCGLHTYLYDDISIRGCADGFVLSFGFITDCEHQLPTIGCKLYSNTKAGQPGLQQILHFINTVLAIPLQWVLF